MKPQVHCFEKAGVFYALDVNSGSLHTVEKLAADMLGLLNSPLPELTGQDEIYNFFGNIGGSAEDTAACYRQIYALYKDGLLFSEDALAEYPDKNIFTPVSPLKAMCFHVAHDCNLRCAYCFAKTGGFGYKRELMTVSAAKKGIDFFLRNSGKRKNLELDFFGGEPLMSWDTVTETVRYAREKGAEYGKTFDFTITTNGVLLDGEKIDFINREMSNVVLSLDGRRETNDRYRPFPDGAGSYEAVVKSFRELAEKREKAAVPGRTDCYVRGTYTSGNLDFSDDVIHLAELGFKHISVEPVALDPSHPLAVTEEHLPKIKEEYDRLLNIMISGKYGFEFFHFNVELDGGPCVIKRLRGCGAGNDYCALVPDGKVYPCHRFAGEEDWILADLNSCGNAVLDNEKQKYFSCTNIYSKPECRGCWARYYCSGGCAATSFAFSGDCRKTDFISCELMKIRTECAAAFQINRVAERD